MPAFPLLTHIPIRNLLFVPFQYLCETCDHVTILALHIKVQLLCFIRYYHTYHSLSMETSGAHMLIMGMDRKETNGFSTINIVK